MGKWIGAACLLVVMAATGGMAQAAHGRKAVGEWDSVKGLTPGTEVYVLAGNEAGPERCVLSAVGDDALTCLAEYPTNDVREVFPREQVRDVWVWELAPNRHVVRWVFVGIGVGLGTALIVANPLVGLAIVGSVAIGIAEVHANPYGMPRRPPLPPRMRRRLVYRGATP